MLAANPTLSEQSVHILLERGLVQVDKVTKSEGTQTLKCHLQFNTQFQSSLFPSHGERSEGKSGVLITAILCFACTVGLTTVVHSTPSFPFYPKFSALYPEMVDAVVLLDCFGFVPTDPISFSKVIRQGMDDMLQFEKKTEEKKRVYTYEKAVE
ncbi:hypothetical protein FQN60_012071, partial [Etheostoma spectabile]